MPLSVYLLALAITIAVETPIVAALFPGRRLRLALTCVAATTITHVALRFGFLPLLPRDTGLIAGEAFATFAEAAAYWAASGDLARGLVASAVANSASFAAGLIVFR